MTAKPIGAAMAEPDTWLEADMALLPTVRPASERSRELEVLFQFSYQVSSQREEGAIVAAALESCLALTGSGCGFLAVLDSENRARVAQVCLRTAGMGEASTEDAALERLERPECRVFHEAALRGRLAFCENAPPPEAGVAAIIGVPVLWGEELIGVIGLIDKPGGYTDDDRRLLMLFANQVGVAVQNARMVGQVEARAETHRRQLDSLSRASQALSGAQTEVSALQRVVRTINRAFNAHATWVMLCDEQTESFSTQMFWRRGSARLFQARGPWARGPFREALESRLPLWCPDVAAEPEFPFPEDVLRAGLRGMLAVPLIAQQQTLGVLAIFTDDGNATDSPDWDYIRAYASQVAAAIQNARWAAAAEARVRREALCDHITAAVRESPDVDAMMKTAVRHLGEALGADRCIALLGEEGGEFEEFIYHTPGCPIELSQVLWEACPVVRQVTEAPATIAVEDVTAEPALADCAGRLDPPPQSLLAVPAVQKNRLVGIFLFHQCGETRRWSAADVELARRVADQVAVGVENIRLFRRAVEEENFKATLVETSIAFASDGALEKVLGILLRQGMRLLGADGAYAWQFEESTEELVGIVGVGHKQEKFRGLRLPLSNKRSIGAQAILQRRTIVASESEGAPYAGSRLMRLFDCRMVAAIPLIVRDTVLGAVIFSITQPGRFFDLQALNRVEILMAHGAPAVENALLLEETRHRAEELEVFWSISQAVTENLEPKTVLQRIAEGARNLLGSDAASVMLFDERRTVLRASAAVGMPEEAHSVELPTDRLMPACLAVDGQSRATANLQDDPVIRTLRGLKGFRSLLSVPLVAAEETAGVLNVFTRGKRLFTIREMKALATLATFAQGALRNAHAYQREYQIARTFQETLLPRRNVRIEGVEVAQQYLAALSGEADVGGDLCDVIPLSEGRVGLMIGDIAGKGLDAAVQSAMVKNRLQAFALETDDPGQTMTRLNYNLTCLVGADQPEWFVTLFYGVLDTKQGELVYANAGHEHPMLLRGDGSDPVMLGTTGPILGLAPEATYRARRVSVCRGDTLVLYTDGFTEARRQNEFLEVDGLRRLVDERLAAAPQEIVEHVCASVSAYAGGNLRDDATLMVVRTAR
jgi:sigma-B regulation protein RsbU (phosphoserine phosphatase)